MDVSSLMRQIWCGLREHPHQKDVNYLWKTAPLVRVETCKGCGQKRHGYAGEGSAFPWQRV